MDNAASNEGMPRPSPTLAELRQAQEVMETALIDARAALDRAQTLKANFQSLLRQAIAQARKDGSIPKALLDALSRRFQIQSRGHHGRR